MAVVPTEAEVLDYFESLSNWGRWGPDDVLGTLNFITDAKRVEAARLVRTGRVVSCSWDIDTALQDDDVVWPPQRYMITTGQGLKDEHRLLPEGILRPTGRRASPSSSAWCTTGTGSPISTPSRTSSGISKCITTCPPSWSRPTSGPPRTPLPTPVRGSSPEECCWMRVSQGSQMAQPRRIGDARRDRRHPG